MKAQKNYIVIISYGTSGNEYAIYSTEEKAKSALSEKLKDILNGSNLTREEARKIIKTFREYNRKAFFVDETDDDETTNTISGYYIEREVL